MVRRERERAGKVKVSHCNFCACANDYWNKWGFAASVTVLLSSSSSRARIGPDWLAVLLGTGKLQRATSFKEKYCSDGPEIPVKVPRRKSIMWLFHFSQGAAWNGCEKWDCRQYIWKLVWNKNCKWRGRVDGYAIVVPYRPGWNKLYLMQGCRGKMERSSRLWRCSLWFLKGCGLSTSPDLTSKTFRLKNARESLWNL